MSQRREVKKKKRQKKQKFWIIIIAVIVLLFTGMGISGVLAYKQYVEQPKDIHNSDMILTKYEPQTTARIVAEDLEEKGVIRNGFIFRWRARERGMTYIKKAGNYAFSPSMTSDEIIDILIEGKTTHDYQFVIGDGIDIDELISGFTKNEGERIQISSEINEIGYIQLLREKYPFLPEEILNDGLRNRLEGFLAPGKYLLKDEDDFKMLIEKALEKFQEHYLNSNFEQRLKERNRNLFEVVTLASVVRGEVYSGDTENQKLVAGVFFNRLAQDGKLESDVTVGYAIAEKKPNYTQEELEIDSPYNTYRYPGLPVGPVSNPGFDVLEATLDYTANDYYFFLADICDDNKGEMGKIYYSKTYDEHRSYSREYLACIY